MVVDTKTKPDKYDRLEESTLENERKHEEIENLKSYRELREKYARRVWYFLCFYTSSVFILIILNALFGTCVNVPVSVLVTLAGSTAVAAIGLVGIVAQGLFR